MGLGSNFDGATVPDGIKDVAGLPALLQAMRTYGYYGYNDALMRKLAHENWFGVLARTWG